MNHSPISIGQSVRDYWKRERASASWLAAARGLAWVGWEFLRDSLPSRKRQRYGDVDYDWEFRVNTTSATVSWRARLLGLLHSAYQPIEPELFREIIGSLNLGSLNTESLNMGSLLGIDFSQFTFIDIGSGKGRALLLAAEYPFRRVVGVELVPELNSIAEENLHRFPVQKRASGEIQTICGDATEFVFPSEALVIFLFHPLPEAGLTKLVGNLDTSLRENPRPAYVIYVNPILERIVAGCSMLTKMGGTHQYSVFRTGK